MRSANGSSTAIIPVILPADLPCSDSLSICCTVLRLFLSICCNLSICCTVQGLFLSICCSHNAAREAEQSTTTTPRLAARKSQYGGKSGRGQGNNRLERRREAEGSGTAGRVDRPMIKTGYFSVLFRAKPREKRAFPQVAKKLTSANPQKSGSFLSWGKECCFLRRPTQAVTAAAVVAASTRAAMASAVRVLRACRLDSLEKVRFVVINSLEKVRFPR